MYPMELALRNIEVGDTLIVVGIDGSETRGTLAAADLEGVELAGGRRFTPAEIETILFEEVLPGPE